MKRNKGALRWNFKRVMDDLEIGTIEMAEFMGVNKDTVTNWRKATYFPQISEIRWLEICETLNEICYIRGEEVQINPLDLIEFCPNEERDIESTDCQDALNDVRDRSKTGGKKKVINNSKNTVAA
jgi:hypothetical protein